MNVQFIGEHLLEINPRISTIVYQDDLNLPYLAVRHAVGELDEEQLGSHQRPSARRGGRCATTTRSSTTSRERRRRSERSPEDAASQSAIYGIGPSSRASRALLLLPIYARHLGQTEVGRVGQVVALVAVGATVAQLGLVNALFRFAAERAGRRALRGRAHGDRAVHGRGDRPRADRGARDAARRAALPGDGARVSGSSLAPACSSRSCTSPVRVSIGWNSGRSGSSPSRSSTSLSPSSSASSGSSISTGRARPRRRLLHGHARRARGRPVGSAQRPLRVDRPRAASGRSCASACRSCPHASRSGRSTSRTGCSSAGSPRARSPGSSSSPANTASSVALLVTAFQLAWPPFAYGDQGRRGGSRRLPLGAHRLVARRARTRSTSGLRADHDASVTYDPDGNVISMNGGAGGSEIAASVAEQQG